MPVEAKVKITVTAGKETVEDTFGISADSAVAITEQMVCANDEAWIELYAGKRESICFLLLKTDPTVAPVSPGCPAKDPEYVHFDFTEKETDIPNPKPLKHFAFITPELGGDTLPPMVNYLYINNKLTKDVKISVLAARKKPMSNGEMNKSAEHADRLAMATGRKPR